MQVRGNSKANMQVRLARVLDIYLKKRYKSRFRLGERREE